MYLSYGVCAIPVIHISLFVLLFAFIWFHSVNILAYRKVRDTSKPKSTTGLRSILYSILNYQLLLRRYRECFVLYVLCVFWIIMQDLYACISVTSLWLAMYACLHGNMQLDVISTRNTAGVWKWANVYCEVRRMLWCSTVDMCTYASLLKMHVTQRVLYWLNLWSYSDIHDISSY